MHESNLQWNGNGNRNAMHGIMEYGMAACMVASSKAFHSHVSMLPLLPGSNGSMETWEWKANMPPGLDEWMSGCSEC